MQLTTGEIHTAYVGLTNLEQDQAVRLSGDVRMKIAIDRNRLEPIAVAYERARTRAFADLVAANREAQAKKSEAEIQAELAEQDATLRQQDNDVEVKTLLRSDLRLDDNPRITGVLLSQIMPILEGVE